MPAQTNHKSLFEAPFRSDLPTQLRFPAELVPLVKEAITNYYARMPFNHDTFGMIKGFVLDDQYTLHLRELQAEERARLETTDA